MATQFTSKNPEGKVALLRFQEDTSRKPPFLIRNIKRSLACLVMGSSPSKVSARGIENECENQDYGGNEERSAKRRRMESHGPDIIQHSKPPVLAPAPKLYGSTRANVAGFITGFAMEKPNADFQKALRIDILKITANFEEFVSEEEYQEPIVIRCRATIGMFRKTPEDGEDGQNEEYDELGRKYNIGDMTISKTADGKLKRDIRMAQPFVFLSNELFADRSKNLDRQPDSDGPYHTFDLAEKYKIQVNLERIEREEHNDNMWPHVRPAADRWDTMSKEYAGRHLHNSSLEVRALVPMHIGQRKAPSLTIVHKSRRQNVPYALHLQTEWSTVKSMPPLAILSNPNPRRPLHDKGDQNQTRPIGNSLAEEIKSQAVENKFESRPQRAKTNPDINYNLKRMSYETVGRSPVKRKRKSESSDIVEESPDLTITFSFGRADSAENAIPRQHSFPGLKCPFCDRNHSTFDQYRFHLHNDHHNFKFSLRRQNSTRSSFFVEVVKSNSADDRIVKRTFQLGKEVTLFDLENYLNGDNSWVKNREGPIHNHWPDEFTAASNKQELVAFRPVVPTDSPATSSSHSSQQSSLNTSPRSTAENDKSMDLDVVSESLSKLGSQRRRKVVLVPRTAKPLFHTVTKRQLVAGEELPSSDDEKDESWLHQKHRDMLNDFEDLDVNPAEKEYLNKWNLYAIQNHHNVDILLPDTVDGFVNEHLSWLLKPERQQKFMAHMTVLVLQGVMTEALVGKWVKMIRKAETEQEDVDGDVNMVSEDEEEEQELPRKTSDCSCLKYVPLHDRLVCIGQNCTRRYYHKTCAPRFNLHPAPKGRWKCNDCLETRSILAFS